MDFILARHAFAVQVCFRGDRRMITRFDEAAARIGRKHPDVVRVMQAIGRAYALHCNRRGFRGDHRAAAAEAFGLARRLVEDHPPQGR